MTWGRFLRRGRGFRFLSADAICLQGWLPAGFDGRSPGLARLPWPFLGPGRRGADPFRAFERVVSPWTVACPGRPPARGLCGPQEQPWSPRSRGRRPALGRLVRGGRRSAEVARPRRAEARASGPPRARLSQAAWTAAPIMAAPTHRTQVSGRQWRYRSSLRAEAVPAGTPDVSARPYALVCGAALPLTYSRS